MSNAGPDTLPILDLSFDLDRLELTGLNALQNMMFPHLPALEMIWWAIFALTFCCLCARYLVFSPPAAAAAPAASGPHSRNKPLVLYRRIFRIEEIEQSPVLKMFGGALLIGYTASFAHWINDPSTAVEGIEGGMSLCWPFFQSCENFIFLRVPPGGYSQPVVYMALMGCILLAGWGLAAGKTVTAHACMTVLFLWSAYVILISYTYNFAANYTYYLMALSFVYLFAAHKRFFACLTFVSLYYLSTASKISDTWILGTYFTSLKLGLPLFPDALAPVVTNTVIAMEMVGAWFLLSRRPFVQRAVFSFFVFFHLYSGIFVSYHYPTIVLPMLIVLFGPYYTPAQGVPGDLPSLRGWLFLALLGLVHFIPALIPGDRRMTLEGNFYGLFMFEANHQCHIRMYEGDRLIADAAVNRAYLRCDPYKYMKQAQKRFCDGGAGVPHNKRLVILHSINGGPFYEIVNEADVCGLTYRPFGRNEWIRTQETAPALYRPSRNIYK